MGVIKFALKTLINDLKQAIFYFFTILVSIAVIVNVFNLLYNERIGGVNEGGYGSVSETKYSAVILVVLVVAILIIFYANQYFLLRKKKEYAIALLSGKSIGSVISMSILHNCIIIGLGAFVGIVVGIYFIPYILSLGYSLLNIENGNINAVSNTGIIITIGTFFLEIFYVVLINIGSVYRLQVVDLMNEEKKPIKKSFEKGEKYKKAYVAFLILPFVIFILGAFKILPRDVSIVFMPIFMFLSLIGLQGSIMYLLPEYILKIKSRDSFKKTENFLAFSEFNKLINTSKSNMFLIAFTVFTLIYTLCSYFERDKRLALMSILAYIAVTILFSIALIFRQIRDGMAKKNLYKKLNALGFTKDQLRKMIIKTNLWYLALLILSPMVFVILCTSLYTILGVIPIKITFLLVVFSVIVFILTVLITIGTNLSSIKRENRKSVEYN